MPTWSDGKWSGGRQGILAPPFRLITHFSAIIRRRNLSNERTTMPGLRDYLQEKAKEHNMVERLERRREWVAAVTKLIEQLENWLREADPQRLLSVYTTMHPKLEQHLGHYDVPGLEVVFGDTQVRIIPVGRAVLRSGDLGSPQTRAVGRVDISNGGRKLYLFRYVV